MRIVSQGQSIDTITAPTNTKATNVQENMTPNVSMETFSNSMVEKQQQRKFKKFQRINYNKQ